MPSQVSPFLSYTPAHLGSATRWILTWEVESGEPEDKAYQTRACGRLAASTQAGALHRNCQVLKSFPRSRSETIKEYQ
jgi:hypothetical protein